jgi:hypothetical protein
MFGKLKKKFDFVYNYNIIKNKISHYKGESGVKQVLDEKRG